MKQDDEFDEPYSLPVGWKVISFNANEITVQIDLEDENLQRKTALADSVIVVTFWGTKYF